MPYFNRIIKNDNKAILLDLGYRSKYFAVLILPCGGWRRGCVDGWPSFITQRCVLYHDCGCAIQAILDLAVAGVGHAFGLGVTLGTIVLGSWRYCSIESS